MVESNYDILGIVEGTTEKEIRDAFRRLALQFHSDRGGENEQFIKIKQAYDDLKIGKKYPDTDIEKIKNSRVYSDESEEDVRRKNQILGQELSKEMKTAEEWASALNRSNVTATRLFGSKTLGEIELERKATGTLSIKGNFMAGSLTYDGPIIMQGSITSPSWTQEYKTNIRLTKGDFKFIEPLENKYKIENGAQIVIDNGNAVVGNILSAREILFYGSKLTYDCVIKLKQNGSIRFFETFSIQGLSGDAIIELENGKKIRLFDLKTKKIKDLADEFVQHKENYNKDATMVGNGFTITYDMLDNLSKKPTKKSTSNWKSKFKFSKN